jgi:hypothetical protein
MKVTLFSTVALALLCSSVFGAGLADKKKWKAAKADMKDKIEAAEKACGSQLKVSFDEKSFTGWNETLSLGGSCGNAVEGLSDFCGKDEDNKAEGAKIKSIACKAAKTASLKVDGDAMTYVMDIESGGWTSSKIAEELEKAL